MDQAPPPYENKGYPPPQQPGYPPQQPGYPPQQPGYPPQQPGYPPSTGYGPTSQAYPGSYNSTATTTTVISTQPIATLAAPVVFSEFPVAMTCPACRCQIVTSVLHEPGSFAYLLFFLMCIFGFWICCFIPFCVDSCKDAVHSCPNCRAQLGVFRRM